MKNDEQDHIEQSQKKKKKRNKNIIVGLIILILLVTLIYIRFSKDDFFGDPYTPWYYKVGIILLAVLIVFFIIAFLKMSKSSKHWIRWTHIFIINLFTNLILPGLFLVIIILGAVTAKYPPNYNIPQFDASGVVISNTTAPFDVNVNKSMNLMGDTIAKSFSRLAMEIYNLGAARPNFWIFITIVAVIISIWISFPSKSSFLEDMDAQQIIDSITEEDYKELDRYEQAQLAQKNWWEKLEKNEKLATAIITSLIIIAIIMGVGFWFWG